MSTTKTSFITQLGPRGLKELKTGPAMNIYFQPSAESEKVILSDAIPLKVGMAFSYVIKDHLQNKNVAGATFTITSGDKPSIKAILRWMLTSCNGFGLVPFEPQATFGENLAYIQTADDLGIPTLSKILYDRLQTRISKPTIEDARAIYSLLDSNHPLRILFVKTVSECIGTRTLKNWGKFLGFAEENVEYAAEVEEYRRVLNAPQIEARRAARREENREYWAASRAEEHEAYLVRKKKRDDRAKEKEEWERSQASSGKDKNGCKTFNGKIIREVAKGIDCNTQGRDVPASDRAENASTSNGSTSAQSKSSVTGNTTSSVTPEKKAEPAHIPRLTVAVALNLTNAQPTITIGDVTKEVAPTVKIEGPEEAANAKSSQASTKDRNKSKAAKEGTQDKTAQGGKDKTEGKEGEQLPVITRKKKHKKH